jgi:hypothetical protein
MSKQTEDQVSETTAVTEEVAQVVEQSPPEQVLGEKAPESKSDGETPPPVDEYVPNYKFKAYEKDFEFEDWARAAIKNKEAEEKARALHAKAYAHDDLREKYTKVQEYRTKYDNIEKNISKLEKLLNTGDVGGFFEGLGYNKETATQMLSKYVLDQINYKEMPEDQRKAFDHQRMVEKKAMTYEEQVTSMQSKLEEYETRQLDTELSLNLNDPTVSEIVRAYDERMGKPGAFREEVILRGDSLSRQMGRIATPKEVVAQMADFAKKLIGPLESYQQPTVPARPKPALPNIQSRGNTSPAKQRFNNLEDLEKHIADRGWNG